jgi:Transposase
LTNKSSYKRRPWERLSPIFLLSRPSASIWPSTSFRFTALMLRGALSWPTRSGATSYWSSSLRCLLASSGSRHAARRITGRGNSVKLGHDARLTPPAYVKAYVRRQKNDAADAAAICEAVTRPSMRFVPLRSLENQAALMHHRVREMLVAQRTQVMNAVRGHLAEIGVIAAQGPKNARDLAKLITADEATLPWLVRAALEPLVR